jgi:hypothetical protein
MPSSYVSNHVHMVFSMKNRLKMIPEAIQPKLWAYMAGIATSPNMHAVVIGGIEDHARANSNGANSRHIEGRAGVEGKFIAMDERTFRSAV